MPTQKLKTCMLWECLAHYASRSRKAGVGVLEKRVIDFSRPAPSRPAPGTKLCGYLAKRGGPLRAWKRRWFMYEEKKSQLFYYRTAQDLTPLGRVGLGSATFTLPLKGEEGCFHIQTPERTYILKVGRVCVCGCVCFCEVCVCGCVCFCEVCVCGWVCFCEVGVCV